MILNRIKIIKSTLGDLKGEWNVLHRGVFPGGDLGIQNDYRFQEINLRCGLRKEYILVQKQ